MSGAEETIKQLSTEIAALVNQVAENHKLADLVLIEIKTVFARSLAKIQATQDITQQHLPVNKKTMHEVIVAGSLPKIQTTQDTAQQDLPVKKQAEPKEAIYAGSLAKT